MYVELLTLANCHEILDLQMTDSSLAMYGSPAMFLLHILYNPEYFCVLCKMPASKAPLVSAPASANAASANAASAADDLVHQVEALRVSSGDSKDGTLVGIILYTGLFTAMASITRIQNCVVDRRYFIDDYSVHADMIDAVVEFVRDDACDIIRVDISTATALIDLCKRRGFVDSAGTYIERRVGPSSKNPEPMRSKHYPVDRTDDADETRMHFASFITSASLEDQRGTIGATIPARIVNGVRLDRVYNDTFITAVNVLGSAWREEIARVLIDQVTRDYRGVVLCNVVDPKLQIDHPDESSAPFTPVATVFIDSEKIRASGAPANASGEAPADASGEAPGEPRNPSDGSCGPDAVGTANGILRCSEAGSVASGSEASRRVASIVRISRVFMVDSDDGRRAVRRLIEHAMTWHLAASVSVRCFADNTWLREYCESLGFTPRDGDTDMLEIHIEK